MSLPKEFISKLKTPALTMEDKYGVPAPVIIAQAALESGWGRHIPEGSNNIFGIKAVGTEREYVIAKTQEFKHDQWSTEYDKFRKYSSYQESIRDHSKFLTENPRYKPCFETDDPDEFARRLQTAGYATDPDYADKLIRIMRQYDLYSIRRDNVLSNITKLPSVISSLIAFFRMVEQLVKMVEDEGPEEGGGKEKKNLVLNMIEVAYDLTDSFILIPVDKVKIIDASQKLIEIWVSFFNLVGIFK